MKAPSGDWPEEFGREIVPRRGGGTQVGSGATVGVAISAPLKSIVAAWAIVPPRQKASTSAGPAPVSSLIFNLPNNERLAGCMPAGSQLEGRLKKVNDAALIFG